MLTQPTVSSSTATTQINSGLPLILVLPNDFTSQPVEKWQNLITQTFRPVTSASTLEWDWINAELESITVETFRELVGRLSFGVGPTTHRLAVVLAADLAPVQAQNALLKSLEEPPARTTLVLAVTNLASLLPTILSRCQVQYATADLAPVTEPSPPEFLADLKILTQFSQKPGSVTYSQLIQLASRYKDRVSAKKLLQHWLESISQTPSTLSLSQLKLTQVSLVSLAQLDQNLSPTLVLEELWLSWRASQTT